MSERGRDEAGQVFDTTPVTEAELAGEYIVRGRRERQLTPEEREAAARRAALEEAARAVCIWCADGIQRRGSRHVMAERWPDCAAWEIWQLLENRHAE